MFVLHLQYDALATFAAEMNVKTAILGPVWINFASKIIQIGRWKIVLLCASYANRS